MGKMYYILLKIKSPIKRLAITLMVNFLYVFFNKKQKHFFTASPRFYIHWIGNHNRPARLERPFAFVVLFVAMVLLTPNQYLIWSTVWGGAISVFVIVQSMRLIFQRVEK